MPAAPASLRRAQPWLGTFVEITAAQGGRRHDLELAITAAFEAVARVHRLMSFHDPESDVSRLNRAAGMAVAVDPWTYQVLDCANDLYHGSEGGFDIAVASVLQRLGLLPGTEPPPFPPPLAGEGREGGERRTSPVELLTDNRAKLRNAAARIDLGGIAKGFAVDRALAVLREHGARSGLVNAGGDVAAFGDVPQIIHIRDPSNPQRLLCAVQILEGAIASSGSSFDPMNSPQVTHCAVIDPITQQPASTTRGATVRAPSCIIADALTKVVMIKGHAAGPLLERYEAAALVAMPQGEFWATSNWQGTTGFAA